MTSTIHGVCSIMLTPFLPDESVDEASLKTMVEDLIAGGVGGLTALGIMGEAHRLLDSERTAVIRTTVSTAAGRVPVVVGCTSESTFAAVARVREAAELGATAVMIAPSRGMQSPVALLRHYRAIAETAAALGVTTVIQDEPVTTGVTLSAATLAQLVALPGVDHIKVEQAPSATKIADVLALAPHARCFGGLGGQYVYEELSAGAAGVMTGYGFPAHLVEVTDAYRAGEIDGARRAFFHYLPLIRFEAQLGIGGVAIRKQIMVERGVIAHATVRHPGAGVDATTLAQLRDLLAWYGLARVA